MSPATPRLRSTSWQNWWIVAMVAASKETSACVEPVVAGRDGGRVRVEQPRVQPVGRIGRARAGEQLHGLVELAAHALAAAPGWRRG